MWRDQADVVMSNARRHAAIALLLASMAIVDTVHGAHDLLAGPVRITSRDGRMTLDVAVENEVLITRAAGSKRPMFVAALRNVAIMGIDGVSVMTIDGEDPVIVVETSQGAHNGCADIWDPFRFRNGLLYSSCGEYGIGISEHGSVLRIVKNEYMSEIVREKWNRKRTLRMTRRMG
jgi:hypothetical protein